MNNKKYAYATIITNTKYNQCIKRNAQRLQYLNSIYPYVIMVGDNVLEEEIKELKKEPNIIIKKFKYIDFLKFYEEKNFIKKGLQLFDFSFEKDTLHKYQILSLIEYDKILFLDADLFILENSDKCFETNIIKNNKNFIFENINDNNINGIEGPKFLCKPDLDLYKEIYENIIPRDLQWTDENIAKKYFYDCIINESLKDLTTFHFSGIEKIWNFPHIFLKYLFEDCSSKDFNYLIDKYWVDGIEEIGLLANRISYIIKKISRDINFYNVYYKKEKIKLR